MSPVRFLCATLFLLTNSKSHQNSWPPTFDQRKTMLWLSVYRFFKFWIIIFSGAFSQVRLAESKEHPGELFAIKVIDKKALKGKEDSLENEIRVLRRWVRNNLVLKAAYYLVLFCDAFTQIVKFRLFSQILFCRGQYFHQPFIVMLKRKNCNFSILNPTFVTCWNFVKKPYVLILFLVC